MESIPEFFAGKSVFITGANGFMGKILVEKLLRSCSDLDRIFVLMRERHGMTPQERWSKVTQMECFSRLKKERPGILEEKVTVLKGDIMEDKLGLAEEDYRLLSERVGVVFHVAASVRFNDSLSFAVAMNLGGTKRVVDLALTMKNIKSFVHVSTTYCNCDQSGAIEEKLYSCRDDWQQILGIVNNFDESTVSILAPKLLRTTPNTYIFTKKLAERVINDHSDRLPVVIFRPSIVVNSWKEPMPGWIDNLNGPVGLILGSGSGVVRLILYNPDVIPDYMPVDIATKGLIVAAWKRATFKDSLKLPIYQSATQHKSWPNWKVQKVGFEVFHKHPISTVMWYPTNAVTTSITSYKIQTVYKHFLPAVFFDTLLRIKGDKPRLLKMQVKIQNAFLAISYFTLRSWTFSNDKFLALIDDIQDSDREDFDFGFEDADPQTFFETGIKEGKRFLLNETEEKEEYARKLVKRLFWLDQAVTWSIRATLIWLFYNIFLSE